MAPVATDPVDSSVNHLTPKQKHPVADPQIPEISLAEVHEPARVSTPSLPHESLLHTNDPHHLPSFDEGILTTSTTPILYLPPLLSSLPHGLQHSFTPSVLDRSRRPLNTETRLPEIDPASLALHKALHGFQPVTAEYAEIPYDLAFNWDSMRLPESDEREWYCVVFRSKRKEGSDGGPLYEADRKAHEEAVQNGGLILYWYGIPHPVTELNLATCIWQSRQHAIAASSHPHHVRAMRLAAASYERYELSRYRLKKVKGETGLRLALYDRGDVGW